MQPLFNDAVMKFKKSFANLMEKMLVLVSTKRIEERPGRWEPRMKKKRPKPFPLLERPRQEYKEMRESGELIPA
ncbi:MAG: hypothetical protein O3A87_02935 [Verrucomicrobia bacterium]|nr:hypothetical protein [Verrucomicrobiota bacterium]